MKKIVLIIILAILAILVINSMKGREEPLPRNDLQEEADYQATTEITAGNYEVVAGSEITWKGADLIKEHPGTLGISSGSFTVSEDGLVTGMVVMDMNSITSGESIEQLENHLRSADFFDVENYSEATFLINSYLNGSLSGDLTVKGITQPVSIPATIAMNGDTLVVSLDGSIDRTLWDIRFRSNNFFDDLGDQAIDDEIEI